TQAMIVERMAVAKQTINNVIIELCEKEYIKKISSDLSFCIFFLSIFNYYSPKMDFVNSLIKNLLYNIS
ncbi:MAG: helix-turn-helix domain-containing protein, partial [Anaerococcus hydrogenalis]|nr:helix-turn-helix domain-containing protein [Anaerococcus hydrogenalis]